MTFDEAMMREALKEANLARGEGEMPVGCVIVKDGRIIARGHNMREQTNDPTAHAEIVAIRRASEFLASWRLTGCVLYVTLEPCPMCAGAISQARIEHLVYGAKDPAMGCAGSVYRIPEDPAFSHFCRSDGGIIEDACREILSEFFAYKRRNNV